VPSTLVGTLTIRPVASSSSMNQRSCTLAMRCSSSTETRSSSVGRVVRTRQGRRSYCHASVISTSLRRPIELAISHGGALAVRKQHQDRRSTRWPVLLDLALCDPRQDVATAVHDAPLTRTVMTRTIVVRTEVGSAPTIDLDAIRWRTRSRRTSPLCCQAVRRRVLGAAGADRDGDALVGLVMAREWLLRRAGVAGCEPVTLDAESFPVCPPGSFFFVRESAARWL
jgi:hypothetical protein